MLNRFKSTTLALLLGAALPPLASAQGRPIELGIDALSFRVATGGGVDIATLSVPMKTFRAGFFVGDQVSVEPRISFDYVKQETIDAFTELTVSLGALYHFTPDRQQSQVYVRPVGSISFVDAFNQSATQVSLGVGLGVKLPILRQLAARLELEYAHGFENDDFTNVYSLAAVFGFSFFTR